MKLPSWMRHGAYREAASPEQRVYTGTIVGAGGQTLPLPSLTAGSRAEALEKAKAYVRRNGGDPSRLKFDLKLFSGLGEFSGINQKDYTHYVILVRDNLIESGWSYIEDAKEHIRENLPPGIEAKVYTKLGAVRAGLDPDDDNNWSRGVPASEEEDEPADAGPDIQDDDFTIQDKRRGAGYEVYQSGRIRAEGDWDYVLQAVRTRMEKDQFYPNVWYVNERGNIDLLDPVTGKIIKSWV